MMPLRPSRRVIFGAALAAVPFGMRTAWAAEGDFARFLAEVRRDAIAQRIRPTTVDLALRRAEYLPRVIELDRKQPEHTMTFAGFIEKFVTPQRKEDGRRALSENWPLLSRVQHHFNVQARFVVALWGFESNFGKNTGNFSVVSALATLAFDGRRSSYFRGELLATLRILDQGHITPEAMNGSWAGAMGQCQFMPSTFLNYAFDFDGDGRRDIWNDRADVFGSIANFISHLGWHGDQNWGRDVLVPANFDTRLTGLDIRRPTGEWSRLGVRSADAGPLPGGEVDASLVMPDGPNGPALLVYDNFRAIMKWNKSTYFAAAVGYLADSLASG